MVGFFFGGGGGGEVIVKIVSGRECRGISEIGCKEAFKEHPAAMISNPSCVPSAYMGAYVRGVY